MSILSEVDLDGGAVELHVGVSHPSGKLAFTQGLESPWFLVVGPVLTLEVSIGPFVDRGQLVQVIQDELLEDSEPQGNPDLVAVEAGKVRAFLHDGQVIKACMPHMQPRASDITGGLA